MCRQLARSVPSYRGPELEALTIMTDGTEIASWKSGRFDHGFSCASLNILEPSKAIQVDEARAKVAQGLERRPWKPSRRCRQVAAHYGWGEAGGARDPSIKW